MTMTVEVFKTNVPDERADEALAGLLELWPDARITFDLDDCDRVLRIEADEVSVEEVRGFMHEMGIACEELVD